MNDKTLVTVNCSMCRLPMDCDESLLLYYRDQEMADVMFQDHWKKVPEKDKENEILAKEFFYNGATQAFGFLICGGMPLWCLDELEGKIKMVREIRRGEEGK